MWNREEDLKEWQNIENKLRDLLITRNPGCRIEQPEWYFKEYDLKLIKHNGDEVTFEVKYDRLTSTTGNVAIELSYDGRPSWIFTSDCDYVVYYISGSFRCSLKQDLISRIQSYKKVEWWDWLKSLLYLVPVKDFISFCKKIWQ